MPWEVEENGVWKKMSPEDDVQMEANYEAGQQSFQMISGKRGRYDVRLHGHTGVQTDLSTGRSRKIRLTSALAPRAGLSAKRKEDVLQTNPPSTTAHRPQKLAAHRHHDPQEGERLLSQQPSAPPRRDVWRAGLLSEQHEQPKWDLRQHHWQLPGLECSLPSWQLPALKWNLPSSSAMDAAAGIVRDVDWKQVLVISVLVFIIHVLWDTDLVYPLKLLVVFFHETSHGMAAYLTGGSVDHLEVSKFEGGVTYTQGGNRFLILSAGYLGSLVWGGLILVLAARTRYDRYISMGLGVGIIVIGLWFVRPLVSFGQLFVLASGVALLAVGYKLPEQVNDIALRVIGLTSCMYAVLDIKSDILDRPYLQSDAAMLAQETGTPTLLWGVVWITIAVISSACFLLFASKVPVSDGTSRPFWDAAV